MSQAYKVYSSSYANPRSLPMLKDYMALRLSFSEIQVGFLKEPRLVKPHRYKFPNISRAPEWVPA